MSEPDPVAVPQLERDTCQVWTVWRHGGWPPFRPVLDERERARAGRLTRQDDRDRYAVAHTLLRLVVAAQLSTAPAELRLHVRCPRCGGPHGKPTADGGVAFSLAHTDDVVAVAVTRLGPVGVDVEHVRDRDVSGLAATALAPVERAVLHELPAGARPRALTVYWTRKEAVLKATGDGLAVAPRDIAVSAPDEPPRLVAQGPLSCSPATLQLADLGLGAGVAGAVAVLTRSALTVARFDGTAVLSATT